MNILVLDTNLERLFELSLLLREGQHPGYGVRGCTDPEEALRRLKRKDRRVDLLLMPYQLETYVGRRRRRMAVTHFAADFIREGRLNHPEMKAVVLATSQLDNPAHVSLHCGANLCLTAPYDVTLIGRAFEAPLPTAWQLPATQPVQRAYA